LPKLDEDTRLIPILDNLSQGFLAGVPSQWSGASDENVTDIKAEMVDEIARKHYPLCMRNLHDNLIRDHHLKHFGRLQYGLFLKVSRTITLWCNLTSRRSTGAGSVGRGGHHILEEVLQWYDG
jgi:DNA primase large subunit